MKIIIKSDDIVTPEDCLWMVKNVVKEGLISGNGDCYCYMSLFGLKDKEVSVSCIKNKAKDSYTFSINQRSNSNES